MNDYSYSTKYIVDTNSWSLIRTNKDGRSDIVEIGLKIFPSQDEAIANLKEGQRGLLQVNDKQLQLIVNHDNSVFVAVKNVFQANTDSKSVTSPSANSIGDKQKILDEKLLRAIQSRKPELVDLLISSGSKFTVLSTDLIKKCIEDNQLKILRILFKNKFTFNKDDLQPIYDALFRAANDKNWDLVELCITKGRLDITKIHAFLSGKKWDLLSVACKTCAKPQTIEFCIKQGLKPTENALNLLGCIVSNLRNSTLEDTQKSMKLLIDHGAKITDDKSPSPLTKICHFDLQNQQTMTLCISMLNHVKNEMQNLSEKDLKELRTYLTYVVFTLMELCEIPGNDNPYRLVVLDLLDIGVDVDETSAIGETLLIYSTKHQDSIVLEALLEKGANPLIRDNANLNCLDHAVNSFSIDIVDRLLQEPFDINEVGQKYTPLEQAIVSNKTPFVKLLIDYNANKNDCLELALNNGNLDIIELIDPNFSLSEYFKDVKAKDIPLEFARFFLNSPLELIERQIKKNGYDEKLFGTMPKLLQCLPLIARFNTSVYGTDMQEAYGNKGEYIAQQLSYGQSINKATQNTPLSKDNILDMFAGFAKYREIIARDNGDMSFKNYSILRYENQEGLLTHISDFTSPVRYTEFLPMVHNVYNAVITKQVFAKPITKKNSFFLGYTQMYRTPENKLIPLTSIQVNPLSEPDSHETNAWNWIHAKFDEIPEAVSQLKRLHNELMASESPDDQYDKLAEIYWLGSNTTLYKRGSAQYMQMYTAKIIDEKKLIPLIPKIDYPLIDCVALTLPLKEFKQMFLSLFEPLSTVKALVDYNNKNANT
ncbi:MAG: hypothetical protein JHC93_05625 [Parachlamydiales bacterium]|nr:hypothetical protein [Parachlamydiales bacterium]